MAKRKSTKGERTIYKTNT